MTILIPTHMQQLQLHQHSYAQVKRRWQDYKGCYLFRKGCLSLNQQQATPKLALLSHVIAVNSLNSVYTMMTFLIISLLRSCIHRFIIYTTISSKILHCIELRHQKQFQLLRQDMNWWVFLHQPINYNFPTHNELLFPIAVALPKIQLVQQNL